jgi:hypothetical protein
MINREDLFMKAVLAMAMSRAGTADTEVEVPPGGAQRIDVFSEPDPALAGELAEMGMLGELGAALTLFEPFSKTPGMRRMRACFRKQYAWHHQLERRARAEARERGGKKPKPVPFPTVVVLSPGNPKTVVEQYRFERKEPGLYSAAPGLAAHVVVLSELPRTRATVLLRLGSRKTRPAAILEILDMPADAWEREAAWVFLVDFGLVPPEGGATEEESMTGAELRQQAKTVANRLRDEGRREGERNGRREGEQRFLLSQLRARFGELPRVDVARVEAAEPTELERWGLRLLTAKSLADVFA